MKKLFTLLSLTALSLSMWAKPIFVGHRGSLWGLENSVESFTNGALKGYQYLETDWKLTKDKQFVCSHDDDTKRLGGTKTLASSTLDELQSETLTQKRSGVTYTGRLCSAQEYLDVCRKYNVMPLIELKWTTGINSNDCSNIPLLIDFIEKNGFRNKCIILTSMKPCLEYIRKNYPDIKLQFLTGQYWANHFDWCVQQGIDVDIQTGYFDKSTVERFHEAGLKVNIWTVNDNDKYKSYGDMGVDMVTVDYLDPATVPALDPTASYTPNYTDYPAGTASDAIGYFDNPRLTTAPWPASIDATAIVRTLMAGGKWYIGYHTDAEKGEVAVVDPTTGDINARADIDGRLIDFGVTTDGSIYALSPTQLSYVVPAATQGASQSTTLRTFDEGTVRAIAVSGPCGDAKVYTLETPDLTLSSIHDILRLEEYTRSQSVASKTIELTDDIKPMSDARMYVTTTTRNHLLISSPNAGTVEVYFDTDEGTLTNSGLLAQNDFVTDYGYGRYGKKPLGLRTAMGDDGTLGAVMLDYTHGHGESHVISRPMCVPGSDAFQGGAVGSRGDIIYVLANGTGMASFAFQSLTQPEAKDITPVLERMWIMSNTTDNHPGDIDGTNAQQGTGAGGMFYINNCAEKLIHVFDRTGHIGTMPGGSGWGCARDDAGNIIVRDDKASHNVHSFLIYPAGSTPADYQPAIRITAECRLAGQTNFINASGDVLGRGGYIYLYPNKQTAINMLRLEHGEVVSSFRSTDLKMSGSTAGYVVPLDNNSQNWLYQIRNNAIHEFKGGASVDFSVARASTSAPSRNSTGGVALMNLLGNRIVAINSGSNYLGGFSVKRDKADGGTLISTIAPIGNMGYTAGGNYSTFNWLIPELQDDGSYHIYQYTPANGIAMYRLYDSKTQGIGHIADDDATSCSLTRTGNTLVACGHNVRSIDVYSITGTLVLHAGGDTADISALAPGIYTATAGTAVIKFAR